MRNNMCIDKDVLTKVCGVNRSNIKLMRHELRDKTNYDCKSRYVDCKDNSKHEYLKKYCVPECPEYYDYLEGHDICSKCDKVILSSDWESIARASNDMSSCIFSNCSNHSLCSIPCSIPCSPSDSSSRSLTDSDSSWSSSKYSSSKYSYYPYCSDYISSCKSQKSQRPQRPHRPNRPYCVDCAKKSDTDHSDFSEYPSLYMKYTDDMSDTCKYVERLRKLYELSIDTDCNGGCNCSESECHHVLLGSEFSDIASLLDRQKDQKSFNDIVREWMSNIDTNKNYPVLDLTSIIRYLLIYVVFYFLTS